MYYWRYRAYNAKFEIREGVLKGENFVRLVVQLRQSGLQLIVATTIDHAVYQSEMRLQRKYQKLDKLSSTHLNVEANKETRCRSECPTTQQANGGVIRRILEKIFTYF